jgi:hypothetical protein
MNTKYLAKIFLGKIFSFYDKAILVNSYGRSGSTMLTQSIISSLLKNKGINSQRLLTRIFFQQAWDLNETKIYNGFVYKTHDYPPKKNMSKSVCIIYIFADPVDVVLSLLKIFKEAEDDAWMRLHFEHMKTNYTNNFYSIIDYDTLQLEKHFDSWLKKTKWPTAFVRYEKLWENYHKIGEFLNIPLGLPFYRERTARQFPDLETVKRVEKTYANFRRKVNKFEDFFAINY